MSNEKKPDFSNVKSDVTSTEQVKADFGNVRSEVTSTEQINEGGGGGQQSYVVEKGDTLSAIAQKFYGKASAWKQIFEANRDVIEDPDLIKPGQTLKLPAVES